MHESFHIRASDERLVALLSAELGLRTVTAKCLAGRGIEELESARQFLVPRLAGLRPPTGLAGLDEAVTRIVDAITGDLQGDVARRPIGCFGDYDVDGVTSAALLTSFLRQLGTEVTPRVARRDAGYGFGPQDVEFFRDAGCRLVVVADCGTSDVEAIQFARDCGMEVIVVDHHTVPEADPETPHPAVALVNPWRLDSEFPFCGMASVGLMFYVAVALRTRLRDKGFFSPSAGSDGASASGAPCEPDVRELLDLVALGTVADLVPLNRENRIMASHGVARLATAPRPGVAALMRVAGVAGGEPVDEQTIGWKIAPRLNAPGRLGDAEPSLSLLLATEPAEVTRLADELERANSERRTLQDKVFAAAVEQLDEREPGAAVVVAGRGWASGVVGIVAAKLVDKYQRPSFVIAIIDAEAGDTLGEGVGRGSARTCGGVNVYRVLERCSAMLERFGGHAAAAGLTVSADRVSDLRRAICAAVEAEAADDGEPRFVADAEVQLGDVDGRLVEELGRLAPFGKGNEQPLLLCRGLTVKSSRRVGDGSHLKLQLTDGSGASRGAIGFGLGARDPGTGAVVDAMFVPVISTWNGQRKVELQLREVALSADSG